jgi:hypothetical protein
LSVWNKIYYLWYINRLIILSVIPLSYPFCNLFSKGLLFLTICTCSNFRTKYFPLGLSTFLLDLFFTLSIMESSAVVCKKILSFGLWSKPQLSGVRDTNCKQVQFLFEIPCAPYYNSYTSLWVIIYSNWPLRKKVEKSLCQSNYLWNSKKKYLWRILD